jgi:hypothetical protein
MAIEEKEKHHYLIANLKDLQGTIATDEGEQEISFRGAIGFKVIPEEKGKPSLHLIRLNLLADGAPTSMGETGLIGMVLEGSEYEAEFDPDEGKMQVGFRSILHYPLIDQEKGFREVEQQPGDTCYPSFTEVMQGQFVAKFPEGFEPGEEASILVEGEFGLKLYEPPVLGVIETMTIYYEGPLHWIGYLEREPAMVLKVKPVFIGYGPDDPNATGTSFIELIQRAGDMWDRCGTVRCIKIRTAHPPIYINNESYRVLDDLDEIDDLRSEVTVEDAVEIFVVERWDPSLYWTGCGGTFGSGTESAHIVTCDEQLDVPCPAPCGYGYCGDVNYLHLAHELGHVLNLDHPDGAYGLAPTTPNTVMEGSGFCFDNPDSQSAQNCRNTSNPLLYWDYGVCTGSPDIDD